MANVSHIEIDNVRLDIAPAMPPTVGNGTLTIQKNGTNVQTFTANQSTNATANITVPTKVSELTNDSGYTTNTGTVTQVKVGSTAYNPSSGVVSLPAYPTVNNATLTIQKNGTNVQTFTANASTDKTANITVPTKVSELTNDSGYITDAGVTGVKGSNETDYRTGNVNITKANVGLGNVPNVTTNNQAPTFTQASSRANIASGETLTTIFGKIMKWFADLKAVAFSGSYTDLSNKPTIPTVNNATLTIQKNGTNVQTFTANASENKTANITVPTKVSELTNDSGYTTNTGTVTQVKVGSTAYNPSSGVISLPAYPTDTNNRRVFYGTCSTAAATAAKVIVLSDTTGWELKAGTTVVVRFSNTNTASNVTLNVNNSGAKSIYYNNAKYTSSSSTVCGYANRTYVYTYDGTYWVWVAHGVDDNTTYSSKAATSGGTDVSLVTTGEKYTWNNKGTGTVTQVKVGTTAYNPSSGVVSLPAYPTVNNATLTIQKNGTNVNTFTANASSNVTANITVPTKVSELTNDSGYTTNTGTVTQVKVGSTAYNPSSGVVSLPAYPTVNNATLTIQKNGTNVNTFTANASSNVTANITVPTKVSELTNDSNYLVNGGKGSTGTINLTVNNTYTTTVDGYLRILSGSHANDAASATIMGSDGVAFGTAFEVTVTANSGSCQMIYIKKGMQLKCTRRDNDSSVTFCPITY